MRHHYKPIDMAKNEKADKYHILVESKLELLNLLMGGANQLQALWKTGWH